MKPSKGNWIRDYFHGLILSSLIYPTSAVKLLSKLLKNAAHEVRRHVALHALCAEVR